jgi:hypothetical protein
VFPKHFLSSAFSKQQQQQQQQVGMKTRIKTEKRCHFYYSPYQIPNRERNQQSCGENLTTLPLHISARIKTQKGQNVFSCLRGGKHFLSGRKEESPHVSCNAYCLVVNILLVTVALSNQLVIGLLVILS